MTKSKLITSLEPKIATEKDVAKCLKHNIKLLKEDMFCYFKRTQHNEFNYITRCAYPSIFGWMTDGVICLDKNIRSRITASLQDWLRHNGIQTSRVSDSTLKVFRPVS